ncbi:MAG: chemotaxis protein CheA [Myxococcaceae bacterium]|nr:chemotaxis protein CheA [Myxococcaceae bacterium]
MAQPPIRNEFITEATEIVEAFAREVAALDDNRGAEPDPEQINAVFRSAHSLKGVSAMFGEEMVSTLANQAEDLLDALRLGRVELGDHVLDALVETGDVLNALLLEVAREERSGPASDLAVDLGLRLSRLCTVKRGKAKDPLAALELPERVRSVLTEYEEHRLRENARKGIRLWLVRAEYALADFDVRLAQLTSALKPSGEVVSTLPSAQPAQEDAIAFDLVVGSALPVEALTEVAHAQGAQVTPLWSGPRGVPTPSRTNESLPERSLSLRPGAEGSLRSLTQTVRVDIGKLDALMNAVGELLLVRSNVQKLAESARTAGGIPVSRFWGQELMREARALERKLDELQRGILAVRMVPLGQVFDKLARLFRRVARDAQLEVDFEVSGGDVELDKLIVEDLSDPLMHLLRNAIDHGIESHALRQSRGKSPRGLVTLKAFQQGNHVVIQIDDDGGGIDEERIRKVARERNLVRPEHLDVMDKRDLFNLIFLPGFSTRKTVSEMSGRGVGLDVVKTNISRLSGMIDVNSEAGQGTSFVLTLPLTLAILRALVVEVGDQPFAVPLNSVMEIVTLLPTQLETVERREVMNLRGQTIPFIRLSRMFGLKDRPVDRFYVIVVGLAQQRLGIAVEALKGQQDIVTKSLGGRLRHVQGFAGASELGDRRVMLVLDVAAIIDATLHLALGAG